jgi:hypothetical protein
VKSYSSWNAFFCWLTAFGYSNNQRVGRSWHAANFCNLDLTFISYSFWNIRRKVLIFFYKFDEKRARTPRFTSKLQVKKKIDRNVEPLKKIFSSETTEPISTKLCWNDSWVVLFQKYVRHFRTSTNMAATAEQLAQWFLRRRFLCEFPLGSYVKLSSAVGAILVEGPNRLTYFWKRTTQESFQQSLVEIGSVVSEEKIFFKLCVRWSRLPTKMATKLKIEKRGDEIKKSLLLCNYGANLNQICWNDPWVVPFQNYVWHFRPATEMAATAELNLT